MNATARTAATADSGDNRRHDLLAALGMPRYALLPGDPDRVKVMAAQWDEAEVIDLPRGYRAAAGRYGGVRIGAISTSIGAPSLEIVLHDLFRLGIDTFIRVGTTGALRDDVETGSLIVNDAAVRLDGTTHLYVRPEYPAAASHEVTFALADAASTLGYAFRIGTGATSGSFLAGQGRPGVNGQRSLEGERIFEEMKRAGVLNFEMETAALFTLARLSGRRAGAVCSVIANRMTGEWGDNGGIERACRTAAEAIRRLALWDQRKAAAGLATLTAAALGPEA